MRKFCARIAGALPHGGPLRALVGGAALVLAIRVLGAGLAYLSIILLVRWMGAFEFGVYAYVWSWALLLGALLPLGFNLAVLRFVPEYQVRGFIARLAGIVARSRVIVALASLTATALAMGLLLAIRDYVPGYYVGPGLLAMACVPILSFITLYQGLGRAFGWPGIAYFPFYVLQPVLLLLGLGALTAAGTQATASTALTIMVLATCAALASQAIPFARRMRRSVPKAAPRYHTRYWIAVSLPLFATEAFDAVLVQTDILVLGAFLGPEEVAAYFAALRTAGVLAFVQFAVAAIAAPRISQIHASGAGSQLQSFVAMVSSLTFWPTLLGAAGMLAIGSVLLGFFDPSFRGAYPALAILVVGLVIRAAAGPVEYILNMTGHQAVCARIFAAVALVNLLANLALIPLFGIIGAAIATASANALTAGLMAFEIRRRLGVISFLGLSRLPSVRRPAPAG